MSGKYGIVANLCEPDRVFRINSKCWLIRNTGGCGWYVFVWLGRNKGGRLVEKWTFTKKFHNFRAAWIPEHIRNITDDFITLSGTREEMQEIAASMETFASEIRSKTEQNIKKEIKSNPATQFLTDAFLDTLKKELIKNDGKFAELNEYVSVKGVINKKDLLMKITKLIEVL
jgi:hypothetical protein